MSSRYSWDSTSPPNWSEPFDQQGNTAVVDPPVEPEETFTTLVEEWQTETGDLSSTTAKVLHPAYQRIIGLGPGVVPLLLRELEVRPNHWFHALRAITGDNPVKVNQRGNLHEMTAAWLEWGRKEGYLK